MKVKAVTGESSLAEIEFMDKYDLTQEEAVRFVGFIRRGWDVLEADFNFGAPNIDRRAKEVLRFEDIKLVWTLEKAEQRTDFAEFVNDLIK